MSKKTVYVAVDLDQDYAEVYADEAEAHDVLTEDGPPNKNMFVLACTFVPNRKSDAPQKCNVRKLDLT